MEERPNGSGGADASEIFLPLVCGVFMHRQNKASFSSKAHRSRLFIGLFLWGLEK